jgi:broad specificity phosphatase PhoE
MRRLVRVVLPIIIAGLAFAASAPRPSAEATTVILVRHAEKASATDPDPALSEQGDARAKALADALADAGVSAVITTQFKRTVLTAQPLMERRHLTNEVVPAGGTVEAHAKVVAEHVRKHAGGTVLVVGHSNSIPAIIAALGGPSMPDLCDGEYAALFVMTVGEGAPRLVRAHYGAADPSRDVACAKR